MRRRGRGMPARFALLLGLLLASAAPGQEAPVPADEAGAPPERAAEAGAEDGKRMVIRWLPWQRESFTLAARLRRPVLLYMRAEDCRLCLKMEDAVLTHPRVVESVAEKVVPILVDADLRPDIAARYVVGALPTMVFLLPNGEPMYNVEEVRSLERIGGYFGTPDGLTSYLAQVVDYFAGRGRDLARKAREVAEVEERVRRYEPGPIPEAALEMAVGRVREGLDFSHGGYGTGWKFIEAAPFRLFRFMDAAGADPALRKAVLVTADGMLAGAIHDRVAGGFHHYATTRDWGVPAREKRLEVNARALRLLTAAALLDPENEGYRSALASTAGFMLETLGREDGSFAFSQQGSLGPDDPGSYFEADAERRKTLRPPPLVTRRVTAPIALAATALLEAGAVLGDEKLEQAALAAVDFLAARCYEKGRGMARWLAGEQAAAQHGLLEDQVAAVEAFLAAHEAFGRPQDLQRALDLYSFCRRNLAREGGPLVDRVPDRSAVGMLRRPLFPPDENGRMALAALRLAALTGREELRQEGLAALGALSPALSRLSPLGASYATALLAAPEPALVVRLSPAAGAGLARAARLLPAPALVVIRDAGIEKGARLCRGNSCGPVVDDAAALGEAWRSLPPADSGEEAAEQVDDRPEAAGEEGE